MLCNTHHLDAAITELRAAGYEVGDENVARLSPFVRHHINMLDRSSFLTPEVACGLRPLRNPSSAEDEEEVDV
ncbi:transposase [Saccharopolyspora rhizosphaerae]|uniref:transposase n=1 Tax=Saccharopolyspora rhizosphaerae TaxID=2492662 RepID=UPI001F39F2EC|nr:transposase [Saccharopolyspora rhizosphaerae]